MLMSQQVAQACKVVNASMRLLLVKTHKKQVNMNDCNSTASSLTNGVVTTDSNGSIVGRISAALNNERGCISDRNNILERHIREQLFHQFVYLYKDKNGLAVVKKKMLTKVLEELTVNNVDSKNPDMDGLGQEEWALYISTLFERSWEGGRVNTIFNLRRSGMYGAIKNKFEGKYQCSHFDNGPLVSNPAGNT